MEAQPCTPVFGTLLSGIDLKQFDDDGWADLRDRLYRSEVLVVRGQQLDPDSFLAVGKRLGEPCPQGVRADGLPGYPEINLLSNLVENGRQIGTTSAGLSWHTDEIYFEHPTALTMLYMVEVPCEGGATLYASARAAYEALDAAQQQRLENVRTLHNIRSMYARRKGSPLPPEDVRDRPECAHPAVRTHPVTGRKALYLSRSSMVGVIDPKGEVTEDEIDALMRFEVQPEFTYAHQSRPGDFIVWDNRSLVHSASPYDLARERRLAYRLITAGERPS